jgi:hypothetical protein
MLWNIQTIPKTSDDRYLIGNVVLTEKQALTALKVAETKGDLLNTEYARELGYNSKSTFKKNLLRLYQLFDVTTKWQLYMTVKTLLGAE